jgi:hypothetical protein
MAKMITMRRNGKGQFVAVGRSHNPRPKHHKKAKRRPNWYGAGAVVPFTAAAINPRKKRRHNPPELLGVPIPNVEDTAMLAVGVAGGFAGPPITQGLLNQFLPVSITGTSWGPTLVKGASYVIPPAIGYAIGGKPAMKNVLAGELASFFVSLIQTTLQTAGAAAPAVAGYTNRSRVQFGEMGRAAAHHTAPHHNMRFRGYLAPTPKQALSAFPGARSGARMTRFQSPRR